MFDQFIMSIVILYSGIQNYMTVLIKNNNNNNNKK
jgi:hypothetical protein